MSASFYLLFMIRIKPFKINRKKQRTKNPKILEMTRPPEFPVYLVVISKPDDDLNYIWEFPNVLLCPFKFCINTTEMSILMSHLESPG